MRGIDDPRGQLFYDYIRLVAAIKPKFFLAENVAGIISQKHIEAFEGIKAKFSEIGYEIYAQLFNAVNYEVPQDRKRVIIVGINKDCATKTFAFPDIVTDYEDDEPCLFQMESKPIVTLREAIGDLPKSTPALEKNHCNESLEILNHEYAIGDFSPIYMSRNRRRSWDEPSFTIQASSRQAPLHPDCPPMEKVSEDSWKFTAPFEVYRRLSVRECARVQTFPDDFEFVYKSVNYGYKMIGNAVPVRFAYHLGKAVEKYFSR
jgi:DNA (cytosine-5)-methyltransferase 1